MGFRHPRSAAPGQPLTRRISQLVAATMIASPLAALSPAVAHADGPAVTVSPDAAALTQAQETGKSVPVEADTSTNSTTTANPDGTFTYTATVAPTRVQQNGSWVPVDNTLVQSGGGFAPKAAASQVTFSGGGTGPLATMTNNAGQSLSISWPSSLPAPTVSGATATYANVYPGVDLKMAATVEGGYTEDLVVNNATAAANPALKDIHLATSASTGLSLSRTAADGVQATDSSGNVAFSAPTATMWSTPPTGSGSTTSPSAQTATASSTSTTPQDNSTPVTPLGVTVSNSGIDLAPPASALTGPNVTYPVVIDPPFGPKPTDWMWLSENTGVNYWEGANNTNDSYGHVGYDDWCSNGSSGCSSSAFGRTRTFFSFPTTTLHGTHVTSATLTVTEQGPTSSWSGDRQIDLHGGGGFGAGTTWGTQSVDSSVAASSQFPSINSGSVQAPNFDVTALLQNNVAQSWDSQTMVLEAHDEADDTAYRYVHGDPTLAVTYYQIPAVPTSLSMDESGSNQTSCNTTSPGTWLNSFSGGSINLNAYLPTPGSASIGTTEYGSFWYAQTYPTPPAHWSNIHSGNITLQSTPQKVFVPLPAVSDGEQYEWQVYADNSLNDNSTAAPSATTQCWFRVDLTSPSSPAFGTASAPTAVGGSGTLSVTASDGGTNPSGVAKFLYNVNGTSLTSGGDGEVSVASNGSATSIPLKAEHWGTNWVWVATQDAAGNMSQPVHYDFYTAEANYTPVQKTGDLDGDGKPDFAMIDADGNIRVYSNPETISPNGTSSNPEGGAILVKAGYAPNGVSFRGAIVAHNGSFSGQNCDDLVVIQQGQLAFEKNNYCAATPSNVPSLYPGVARPTTVNGDSTNYNPSDWSNVQQAVVLPPTGSQIRPTLVTLENDNGVETVWAFTPTTSVGHFTTATLLATGSYWNNVTLVSPGKIGATGPALWVRDNTAGSITQYTGVESWAAVTGTPTGGTVLASSGYSAKAYPLLTSDGAVDTSGNPALWAANSLGQLTQIPSTVNGTAVTLGTPVVVGTTGWSDTWMLASTGSDTSGANPATVNSATAWTTDHNLNAGAAAQFNGTTAYAQTTGRAIDTSRSYTVSAWVKPNSLASSQDALSQGTVNHQAFYIGYDQAKGHWYYMTTTSDTPSTSYPEAAGGTATVGQWTHLTAVYDAGAGTITLYVNGVQAATAADTSPVVSNGAFNIGANVLAGGGSPYNQFNGAVSDVETFPYALSASQVSALASGQAVLTG